VAFIEKGLNLKRNNYHPSGVLDIAAEKSKRINYYIKIHQNMIVESILY